MIFAEYWHGVNLPAIVPYIAIAGIMGVTLALLPMVVWTERVALALMQDRVGPNRVGPRGLLQAVADVAKLFLKEDIQPKKVDIFLYYLAPFLMMMIALCAGAALPIQTLDFRHPDGTVFHVTLTPGNINVGLLYILAMSSLGVYALVLAGYSSNNKYSMLGALRASAQLISYELSMGMALLCVVLLAGSLNLGHIVQAQNQLPFGISEMPEFLRGSFLSWYWLQSLLVPVVIYTISMIAETNRTPFDLPEAENELVGGFHTEYSSMKFATFFAGEYVNMLTVSGLNAVIFWGGWLPPLNCLPFTLVPGFIWFLLKVLTGIFFYIWLRATLPRLRYDALMSIGWKRLLPLGLVWLFLLAGYSLIRDSGFHLLPNRTTAQLVLPSAERRQSP